VSINYTTYIAQITNLMVTSTADTNFNTMAPGMIDYAEQRIYRELDLLFTRTNDTSITLSSGVRTVAISTVPNFVGIEQINVWSPVGALSSNATRNPLTPVTKEYLDFAWPTSTATGVPIYYATLNTSTYIVGPTPDQGYTVEQIGWTRPTPLSASNSSTFLTQNLPDVFIAASMVFAAGYMRNYGAQADDPQMPGSWESQYKMLFASANAEELRKRYQSQGWSAMTPNQIATPPRM
jgi:hypothetical protein